MFLDGLEKQTSARAVTKVISLSEKWFTPFLNPMIAEANQTATTKKSELHACVCVTHRGSGMTHTSQITISQQQSEQNL